MSNYPKRTMIAKAQRYIATLPNGSTLFDVTVHDDKDQPVEGIFRAFVELDIDKPVDYEIRPYEDPVRGRTFTLLPLERQSRTAILQDKVRTLEERVNELENSLEAKVLAIVDERIDKAMKDAAL